MSEVMDRPSTALATTETTNLAAFYSRPGGIDAIVAQIEAEARSMAADLDASTEKGRRAIGSLGLKVAKSKTALDGAGAELKADWLAKSQAIDAERRAVRDRLDALRTEIDRPVVEYRAAEAARVARNEAAITAMGRLVDGIGAMTSDQIKERAGSFTEFEFSTEFVERAAKVRAGVVAQLRVAFADAKGRERQAAEEAERQAEQAEADRLATIEAQRIREEQIAREAAERATRDAEAKAARETEEREQAAQREREAAEAERQEGIRRERQARELAAQAQARADQAERDRVAAEERAKRQAAEVAERAEADRIAAAERAQRKQEAAIEAERQRVADEAVARAAEDARRAKNVAHRKQINGEALDAMLDALAPIESISTGDAMAAAKAIITAIAKGIIPHIRLEY